MLKRHILASVVGQGITAALTVALTPIYLQLLGLEPFGLLGVYSVIQSCSVVFDLGLAASLGRESARLSSQSGSKGAIRRLLHHAEIVIVLMAAAIGLAVLVGAKTIVDSWLHLGAMDAESARRAVSWMGFLAGLKLLELLYHSCLIGLQHQVLSVSLTASFALFRGVGAVVALYCYSNSIDTFFQWQMAVSITQVLVVRLAVARALPRGIDPARASPLGSPTLRRFAIGMAGTTLVSVVLAQVDRVVLSSLLPISMLGLFTLASTLASGLTLLAAPVGQVLQPRLTQRFESGHEHHFIKEFHRGAQLIGLMTYAPAAFLIMLPNQILWVWTGRNDFPSEAVLTLRLLSVGYLMNCMLWMPHQAQIAAGWTSLLLKVTAVCAVIAVPISVFCIGRFGLPGASVGFLLSNCLSMFIVAPIVSKRLLSSQCSRWLWADCVLPFMGALLVAAGACVLTVQSRLGTSVLLLLASLMAALASLLLSDQLRPEFVKLFRSRTPVET